MDEDNSKQESIKWYFPPRNPPADLVPVRRDLRDYFQPINLDSNLSVQNGNICSVLPPLTVDPSKQVPEQTLPTSVDSLHSLNVNLVDNGEPDDIIPVNLHKTTSNNTLEKTVRKGRSKNSKRKSSVSSSKRSLGEFQSENDNSVESSNANKRTRRDDVQIQSDNINPDISVMQSMPLTRHKTKAFYKEIVPAEPEDLSVKSNPTVHAAKGIKKYFVSKAIGGVKSPRRAASAEGNQSISDQSSNKPIESADTNPKITPLKKRKATLAADNNSAENKSDIYDFCDDDLPLNRRGRKRTNKKSDLTKKQSVNKTGFKTKTSPKTSRLSYTLKGSVSSRETRSSRSNNKMVNYNDESFNEDEDEETEAGQNICSYDDKFALESAESRPLPSNSYRERQPPHLQPSDDVVIPDPSRALDSLYVAEVVKADSLGSPIRLKFTRVGQKMSHEDTNDSFPVENILNENNADHVEPVIKKKHSKKKQRKHVKNLNQNRYQSIVKKAKKQQPLLKQQTFADRFEGRTRSLRQSSILNRKAIEGAKKAEEMKRKRWQKQRMVSPIKRSVRLQSVSVDKLSDVAVDSSAKLNVTCDDPGEDVAATQNSNEAGDPINDDFERDLTAETTEQDASSVSSSRPIAKPKKITKKMKREVALRNLRRLNVDSNDNKVLDVDAETGDARPKRRGRRPGTVKRLNLTVSPRSRRKVSQSNATVIGDPQVENDESVVESSPQKEERQVSPRQKKTETDKKSAVVVEESSTTRPRRKVTQTDVKSTSDSKVEETSPRLKNRRIEQRKTEQAIVAPESKNQEKSTGLDLGSKPASVNVRRKLSMPKMSGQDFEAETVASRSPRKSSKANNEDAAVPVSSRPRRKVSQPETYAVSDNEDEPISIESEASTSGKESGTSRPRRKLQTQIDSFTERRSSQRNSVQVVKDASCDNSTDSPNNNSTKPSSLRGRRKLSNVASHPCSDSASADDNSRQEKKAVESRPKRTCRKNQNVDPDPASKTPDKSSQLLLKKNDEQQSNNAEDEEVVEETQSELSSPSVKITDTKSLSVSGSTSSNETVTANQAVRLAPLFRQSKKTEKVDADDEEKQDIETAEPCQVSKSETEKRDAPKKAVKLAPLFTRVKKNQKNGKKPASKTKDVSVESRDEVQKDSDASTVIDIIEDVSEVEGNATKDEERIEKISSQKADVIDLSVADTSTMPVRATYPVDVIEPFSKQYFPTVSHVQQKCVQGESLWDMVSPRIDQLRSVSDNSREVHLQNYRIIPGSLTCTASSCGVNKVRKLPDPLLSIVIINAIKQLESKAPKFPAKKIFKQYWARKQIANGKVDKSASQESIASSRGDDNEIKSKSSEILWTEKYEPTKKSEIIGNSSSVANLHEWLLKWKLEAEKPDVAEKQKTSQSLNDDSGDFKPENKRAKRETGDSDDDEEEEMCNTMLISGAPGIGKTSTVYALAKELGFKVFEVNCSSRRSGKIVMSQLQEVTQSKQVSKSDSADSSKSISSFLSRTTSKDSADHSSEQSSQESNSSQRLTVSACSLLLFEDVDLIFDEDEGFLSSVSNLMATTKRPIILTTNDPNFSTSGKLREDYEEIELSIPPAGVTAQHLQLLCLAENALVRYEDVVSFVNYCRGDIRKSMLGLQYGVMSGGWLPTPGLDDPLPDLGEIVTEEITCGNAGNGSKSSDMKPETTCKKDVESTRSCQESYCGCIQSMCGVPVIKNASEFHALQSPAVQSDTVCQYQTCQIDFLEENRFQLLPLHKCKKKVRMPKLQVPPPPKRAFGDLDTSWLDDESESNITESCKTDSSLTKETDQSNTTQSIDKRGSNKCVADIVSVLADFYDNSSYYDYAFESKTNDLMINCKYNDHIKAGQSVDEINDDICESSRLDVDMLSCIRCGNLSCACRRINQNISRLSSDQRTVEVDEMLSLPLSYPDDKLRLFSDHLTDLRFRESVDDVKEEVRTSGVIPLINYHNSCAKVLDYMSTLRSICRSESSRNATNPKRSGRFLHYLDAVSVELKPSTLDQLTKYLQ